MSANYPRIMVGYCTVATTALASALAAMAGHTGGSAMFGGAHPIKLRTKGSSDTAASHYGGYSVCRQFVADSIDEFNGPGPYTSFTSHGATAGQIAAAKAGVHVSHYPRGADESSGFDEFLAYIDAAGLEVF